MSREGVFYADKKDIFVTIRIDYYTLQAIEELMKVLKTKNRSKVVRAAIWFLVFLTNPSTTLKTLLKPDAIQALARGEDMVFIDAIKSFNEIVKQFSRQ
ncbi:MAG: hypothetical protein QXD57_07110 [Ignisphaera sp.]